MAGTSRVDSTTLTTQAILQYDTIPARYARITVRQTSGSSITYTGKTSTTFTGITRGVYGTTNVAHSIGDAVTEALGVASSTTGGVGVVGAAGAAGGGCPSERYGSSPVRLRFACAMATSC